jgi:hypothetical protein
MIVQLNVQRMTADEATVTTAQYCTMPAKWVVICDPLNFGPCRCRPVRSTKSAREVLQYATPRYNAATRWLLVSFGTYYVNISSVGALILTHRYICFTINSAELQFVGLVLVANHNRGCSQPNSINCHMQHVSLYICPIARP